jgi:tetratricopeptide (TPR) repeat protein
LENFKSSLTKNMKKLGFILLFLALFAVAGSVVQFFFHLESKAEKTTNNNFIVDGTNFLNIGRYDEAKRLFLEALKDDPKNAKAAWGLRETEAKEASSNTLFKTAVDALFQENPSDSHVNLFLGEYYVANDESDKAIPYFQQAITQNPDLAEAHFNLAMLYDKKGKFDNAKSELLLAVEIAPIAKYRNKLAHAYIKLNHLDSATAEYEKSSEYPLSSLEVAQLYWQRDRLEIAVIRQLQAVEWLNNEKIMVRPENQDPWHFQISAEKTIELTKLEQKKSYAYLCLSFTFHLLGNTEQVEHYIQEMRNLNVTAQGDVDTVLNTAFATLVQEESSLSGQVEAFKKLYLQP